MAFHCSFEGETVDEVMCHDDWLTLSTDVAWQPSNPEETPIDPYDGNSFIFLKKTGDKTIAL